LRLFVALEISPVVRENLSALIRELRLLAPQARWLRAENLHVTLKFIGDSPPEKLPAIRKSLAAVQTDGPIAVDFCGLGFFPDDRRPRVLWAGITANGQLERLALRIDSALEPLGFPREQRPFSPHLTLARLRSPGGVEALRAAARQRDAQSFGRFAANEFILFSSELKPAAAEHTPLAAFPLLQSGA